MSKRCHGCCYNDICTNDENCEYYSPVEENEELYIEELIEANRLAYYKDWFGYISDYDD